MDGSTDTETAITAPLDDHPDRAIAEFQFGRSSARFEIRMTPAGLLAVGALVSSILLAVTPLVTAATRHLQGRADR